MLKELLKYWDEYQKWLNTPIQEHWIAPISQLKGDFNGFMEWLKSREDSK